MIKYFYVFTYLLVFISSLNANQNTSSLLDNLKNKSFTMGYYFVKSSLNNYFLIKFQTNPEFSIWRFSSDKKWEPVHNANAFDGFDPAPSLINSASYGNKNITFGIGIDGVANQYKEEIASKTLKVEYYFWIENSKAYLIKPATSSDIKLWNLTNEKLWMPLYNTSAYDNFPEAKKTLVDINFNFETATLEIGRTGVQTSICIDTGFCP